MNKNGIAKKIEVKFTGCHGFCQQGPTVMIEPEGTFYCQVTLEDVPEIVDTDLKNGDIVERLLFVDKKSKPKKPVQNYEDIDYFKPQQRIVLRNCGFINPEEIDDYLKIGGYEGIKKALAMPRKEVIEEVKSLPPVDIDYITFSGRGEPTLAKNLGEMIAAV